MSDDAMMWFLEFGKGAVEVAEVVPNYTRNPNIFHDE